VGDWLQGFVNKSSYNIEDLDYLTGSLDFHSLGLVLELGEKGFRMVMEVVANNPLKPQKGGMLAWDPALERDVMIESFSPTRAFIRVDLPTLGFPMILT